MENIDSFLYFFEFLHTTTSVCFRCYFQESYALTYNYAFYVGQVS